MFDKIALVVGIILPFWNIPLISRIIKRKSSKDISLYWALGVWVCLALMSPSAFHSADFVWKVFSIINFILFSFVVMTVLIYRNGQ